MAADGGGCRQRKLNLQLLAGFTAGGDQLGAVRNAMEQGGYVGGLNDFQETVAGIVLQALHLCGSVVESQTLFCGKLDDAWLVETLFAFYFKISFVGEMDESHDAPEVVYPVWVEKVHAPTCLGRRKAAEEKCVCTGWQKGAERVILYGHWG